MLYDKKNKLLEQHNYNDLLQQGEANNWKKVCILNIYLTNILKSNLI